MKKIVLIGLAIVILLALLWIGAFAEEEDQLTYLPLVSRSSTVVDFNFVLGDFRYVSALDSYMGLLTVYSDEEGLEYRYEIYHWDSTLLRGGTLPTGGGYVFWPAHYSVYIAVYATDVEGNASVQVIYGTRASWTRAEGIPTPGPTTEPPGSGQETPTLAPPQ